MDRTETYIKMSDCEEIQAVWHHSSMIGTYPSNKGFGLHYEMGYDGSFYWDGKSVACVDYEYETRYKHSDVWLPRQDELKEMIEPHEILDTEKSRIASLLSRFWYWYVNTANEFTSMEQLWLAFVMKEKYGKTWDGQKWVNK